LFFNIINFYYFLKIVLKNNRQVPVDPTFHGHFYEADCYLVLRTTVEPSGQLTHAIFYWIGEKTSLVRSHRGKKFLG
jgi:hypothetical protein